MRKEVHVKFETKFWKQLKSIAVLNDQTVENEANIMLEKYVIDNRV